MKLRKMNFLLCVVLLVFCFGCTAEADTVVQDCLEVALRANQELPSSGNEIEFLLSVRNSGNSSVMLQDLFVCVPEGLMLAGGSADFESRSLLAGESWSKALKLITMEEASPVLPKTGDGFEPALMCLLLIGSAVTFAVLTRGKRKQILMLFLLICTLSGSACAKTENLRQISISEEAVTAGKRIRLSAAIEYAFPDDRAENDESMRITGLCQTITENGEVHLRWNPVAAAQTYEVYFRVDGGKAYIRCAETEGTALLLDSLPASAVSAQVRVRACSPDNEYGSFSPALAVNPVSVRALYIVEETFPFGDAIHTYDLDTARLRRMFETGSPYGKPVLLTRSFKDQSKDQIRSRIAAMAAMADENDVTIFSLSTHGDASITAGSEAGKLYLSDGSHMTFGELAEQLRTIPGRVVVLMDSCGSGSAIGKASGRKGISPLIEAISAVNEKIVFSQAGEKTAELCVDKFYVITASQGGRNSYFNTEEGSRLLIWMEQGLWNADANGDYTVTLVEMAEHLERTGRATPIDTSKGMDFMLPQVYPEASDFPLFRR